MPFAKLTSIISEDVSISYKYIPHNNNACFLIIVSDDMSNDRELLFYKLSYKCWKDFLIILSQARARRKDRRTSSGFTLEVGKKSTKRYSRERVSVQSKWAMNLYIYKCMCSFNRIHSIFTYECSNSQTFHINIDCMVCRQQPPLEKDSHHI